MRCSLSSSQPRPTQAPHRAASGSQSRSVGAPLALTVSSPTLNASAMKRPAIAAAYGSRATMRHGRALSVESFKVQPLQSIGAIACSEAKSPSTEHVRGANLTNQARYGTTSKARALRPMSATPSTGAPAARGARTSVMSMARYARISAARHDVLADGSLDADSLALVERLPSFMPSRVQQALRASNGDAEHAEALLARFNQLSDSTFATKMKAAVRQATAMDRVLDKLRRQHKARLAQVDRLSRLVRLANEQTAEEFKATVDEANEEEEAALGFALNSALISGMDAAAVGWSRFVRELDSIGIMARHSALARPQSFFEELHEKERQEQERLIQDAAVSARAAIVNLGPALKPHLTEFGITLEDVLPVLSTACHGEWDEVAQLLANPRLLVRQAAAVKCPTATVELSFHLDLDYSTASADVDGLKHRFAQQLDVSRMQIQLALSKHRATTRAQVKVVTIDADAADALLERLKSTKATGARVLGARVLAFPVILGIRMNKHKQAEGCNFHLLLASELRKRDSPALCSTRHQDVDRSWFRSIEVTMKGVMEAVYAGKVLVVSHRWCENGRPDPQGIQEREIKKFLLLHTEIDYVWHDVCCAQAHPLYTDAASGRVTHSVCVCLSQFWSMPQVKRSQAEQTDFDAMLMSVNLLYLGGTVLILLDGEYMMRFWTSAEAWLSTRSCTPSGLQPAENPEQRCKVVLLPGTSKETKGALFSTWAGKTISEACELLRMDEVKVTNKSDKEKLLSKLVKLDESIQGAWANLQEAKIKDAHPPLQQVIDQSPSRPLVVGDDGTLSDVPADHPERAPPEVPGKLPNQKQPNQRRRAVTSNSHSANGLGKGMLPPKKSAAELRAEGRSAKELRQSGFTALQLHEAGFSLIELCDAGYDAKALRKAGLGASALKEAGVGVIVLKAAGFSASNLKAVGFGASDLKAAGFDASDLKAAGFEARDLKAAGFDARDLKAAGYGASLLKAAGFDLSDLKAAGFDASDLKATGFGARDLKAAGFDARDLKAAGFHSSALKAAGYGASDLKAAGFCLRDLKAAGFGASDLKAAGYGASLLKTAGFDLSDLKAAGFDASDLKATGFGARDLKAAGFRLVELKAADFGASDLKAAGFDAMYVL